MYCESTKYCKELQQDNKMFCMKTQNLLWGYAKVVPKKIPAVTLRGPDNISKWNLYFETLLVHFPSFDITQMYHSNKPLAYCIEAKYVK